MVRGVAYLFWTMCGDNQQLISFMGHGCLAILVTYLPCQESFLKKKELWRPWLSISFLSKCQCARFLWFKYHSLSDHQCLMQTPDTQSTPKKASVPPFISQMYAFSSLKRILSMSPRKASLERANEQHGCSAAVKKADRTIMDNGSSVLWQESHNLEQDQNHTE